MGKKNATYVETKKLLDIAGSLPGITVDSSLKTFHKIQGADASKRVYVPQTKTVARVDISGFEHPLAVAHFKPPTSRVKQMVDFTQDEKAILHAFRRILEDGLVAAAAPAAPAEEPAAERAPIAAAQ